MKRSYLIVGAVALGLVFLSVIINFFFSFNASRTADNFLSEISDGHTNQAYLMTGKLYREVTTEKDFRRMMRRWNLRDFQSLDDWESQTGDGQVTISTNVKTKTGDHVSLLIGLTKEDGKWKIARLQGPPPPPIRYATVKALGYYRGHRQDRKAGPQTARPSLPNNKEIEQLIESTLLTLDRAIAAGDFNEFYGKISETWQADTPLNVFQGRLRGREGEKFSLSGLAQATPTFEPAPTLDGSTLVARGKYLLPENSLDFHLQYMREESEWKLVEFWLGFRKPTPDELEDEETSSKTEQVTSSRDPVRAS